MGEIRVTSARELHRVLGVLRDVAGREGSVQVVAERGHGVLTAVGMVGNSPARLAVRLRVWGSGAVVLPVDRCMRAVQPLEGDAEATLAWAGDGRVAVASAGCTVHLEQGEALPPYEDLQDVAPPGRVAAGAFFDALAWVLPVVSTDATRPHIAQVAVLGGRLCGIDGHRMHVAPVGGPDWRAPREAAEVLAKLRGGAQVLVAVAKGGVRFQVGGATLAVREGADAFPTVDQIIPGPRAGAEGTVAAALLRRACARLDRLVASKADRLTVLCAGPSALIMEPLYDRAVVEVPATWRGALAQPVGCNAAYLADVARGTEHPVRLDLAGPMDPIVARVADRLAVIMPMRI
jgi:DNA polymerase III sliding clamp (beta) subunit (PCNA family)